MKNLMELSAPDREKGETFEELVREKDFRLERIVSRGAVSPPGFWYEQPQEEWAVVLRGEAMLTYGDGRRETLRAGDRVILPSGVRHRVDYTSDDCIWLALHYRFPKNGSEK